MVPIKDDWWHDTQSWVRTVEENIANIIDHITSASYQDPQPLGPVKFKPGDKVLVKNMDRANKLLSPWQAGFAVVNVVSPTTVVVTKLSKVRKHKEVVLNVELVMHDPSQGSEMDEQQSRTENVDDQHHNTGDVHGTSEIALCPEAIEPTTRRAARRAQEPGFYQNMVRRR
jgi:hypothetical protein